MDRPDIRSDSRPDAQPAAPRERPSLRLERRYDAPLEEVWRAWTDPQALSAWFGPGRPHSVTRADVDVREGGRFRIGFDTPDGRAHEVSGIYLEVLAPRRLAFTWAWLGAPERESRVTVELLADGRATRMRFLHEQFFDQATRDDHEGGWTLTFDKLGQHLSGDLHP